MKTYRALNVKCSMRVIVYYLKFYFVFQFPTMQSCFPTAISFPNEASFNEFIANDTNLAKTLGGVIFSRFTNGSEPDFSYVIRLHSDPLNVNPADGAAFTGE